MIQESDTLPGLARREVGEIVSETNRYLATGTLAVTSFFYFAALPHADSFAGGLAVSACGAAMVGGLADWFAVSALFRKPLGIPWRTAVIPRNRQRLFAMMVEMVQDELLAKEQIKRKIAGYDIAGVLVNYLQERGGIKTLKRMLHKLLTDILEKIDPQAVARFLERFVRENAADIRLSPLLRGAGGWLLETGVDRKLTGFIVGELAKIVATAEFRGLLSEFMEEALDRYESDKSRRKLFNQAAGLSPNALAAFAQERLLTWLTGLERQDHPFLTALRQRFVLYLQRLEQEPQTTADWEIHKSELLAGVDIAAMAQRAALWLLRQMAAPPQQTAQWLRYADHLVDKMLAAFQADPRQQQRVSAMVKQALTAFVDEHHHQIGALVKERLERFSDDELTVFIEDKVGRDLQFIRVNGSLIGGLAGSILYCLTFWL